MSTTFNSNDDYVNTKLSPHNLFALKYLHLRAFVYAVSEIPSATTTTNKEELIEYLKLMYTMRRMEITNDTEYKVRLGTSWRRQCV